MATVPLYLDLLGSPLERWPAALKKLGNLETKLLEFDIEEIEIEKPVFICGLARSGTTITLEILNSATDFSAHCYSDFPFVHVNYFWNKLKIFFPSTNKKVERAHKDRILVNSSSPEALEEILWISFFPQLHQSGAGDLLDESTENLGFEAFYRDHLKKLLALRGGKRYLTKNNYNLTRLQYLAKLFPDARFVVLVREPVSHVYSMLKQHRLITKVQQNDARACRYMRRHGHFEFGVDFRPIFFDSSETTARIQELWKEDDLVSAYATYWKDAHEYVLREIIGHPTLPQQVKTISYEALCDDSESVLRDLCEFCEIDSNDLIRVWAPKLDRPDYYQVDLTSSEVNTVNRETKSTFEKFGF